MTTPSSITIEGGALHLENMFKQIVGSLTDFQCQFQEKVDLLKDYRDSYLKELRD